MRRLHDVKIDTPEFYTASWQAIIQNHPYFNEERQRFLARWVKAGDHVVDLGAGVFGTVQYIAEALRIADVRLVAVDFCPLVRELSQSRTFMVDHIVADATHNGLPAATFDVVIAGELIEHWEEPPLLVAEMARLCRPGGWLMASSFDDRSPAAAVHGDYPEHLWGFDPEELIALFQPYGQTDYVRVGDYHGIQCRKFNPAS